jgi:hypothetical protein
MVMLSCFLSNHKIAASPTHSGVVFFRHHHYDYVESGEAAISLIFGIRQICLPRRVM